MATENMRREARVAVRVPVVMYRGKKLVSVETSDVSFKGLFVLTTDPPPLRSLVRLQVALLDRSFEVHAMAVHVVVAGEEREAGVGLQFWGLSGSDRAAWDAFVRALVHARRAARGKDDAKAPALTETPTPSGVRIVVTPAKAK
ncbi:MAG: PilZ domain-containing protein [Labilithrix sp.]|nr:PilZ domain-containing protein [Labilithrix sp.]